MVLENKVALVTGASRGIGRQIAISLAKEGAQVIVNYNGSAAKAEEVVNLITEAGGRAEAVQCNVSEYDKAEELMKYIIGKYGRVDILVNNAGITRDNLLMKMTEEEFDAVIDINLKGTFNCIKHLSRQMLKQKGGRIINISSVSGLMGNAGQANYASAKAGLVGLTKTVAKELASRNVTCNAIAPGFIETDMTAQLSDKVKEGANAVIPLKHMGKPEDIANLAVFLAGDGASYITGEVIRVDGGLGM